VIDLAAELFHSRVPGSHVVAYELIVYHGSALSAVRAADLERLGAHMSSWGEVDTFAGLAGRAWRSGQISDETVKGWTRSSSRWWRRAALVSTVPLNVKAQGGHGDPDRTLAVCSALIDDRDPMVVKALSWALRALAVRDPDIVRSFLQRHGARLAPLVVREVRYKLETGRKSGRTARGP
jgi:3-methyladenine DNA glycosylase AlkD